MLTCQIFYENQVEYVCLGSLRSAVKFMENGSVTVLL